MLSNYKDKIDKKDVNDLFHGIEVTLSHAIVDSMLAHIHADMSDTLQPEDFKADAEEYLQKQKMPVTADAITEYSIKIYKEFMDNLSEAIQLDEDTLEISIHPTIWDLEYGTACLPALRYVSKSIQSAIDSSLKNIRNA